MRQIDYDANRLIVDMEVDDVDAINDLVAMGYDRVDAEEAVEWAINRTELEEGWLEDA